MGSSAVWEVMWGIGIAAFIVAELVTPAAFVFLPFAIAAAVAALIALAGGAVVFQLVAFAVTAGAAGVVLWPLGARLTRRSPHHSTGSNRWVGREALVTAEIPAGPGHA